MLLTVESFSKIRIYVDNPYVIYNVKTSSLDEASPFLASYCQGSAGDCYIMTPWLTAISADDFRPIADFVESGEYHPYIIDAGTDRAHLAGVSNVQDKKTEVLRCGAVYTLARQFNMPKLQALVISKFRTLQPYPAEELIAMTELAFGSGLSEEDGLDKLVVSYIAVSYLSLAVSPSLTDPSNQGHYFDLSTAATSQFNKLLTANSHLRNQVFTMMTGTHGSKPTADKKELKVESITTDENTPPSSLDGLLEFAADNVTDDGIHIYEDAVLKENTPPNSQLHRVPLSERTDLPVASSK